MAETGEPPTPAHVKNKLKQDIRAAQTTGPGKATVYQRDALDFLESLEPQSVDLLLTDPPYMTDVEDIAAFARSWVPLGLSRVKPTGRVYIFTGAYPRELHAYLSVLLGESAFSFDNVLVWTYRNTLGPSPSHGYKLNWQSIFYLYGSDAPPLDCPSMIEQFTVQDVRAPDARLGDRYHAWQKPDELAERLIQHSTRPNHLIADPFAGTGTFLAAALRLGRIGIGSETSGAMLAICQDRGIEVIRG
jgi:site-specific DNA-methyltransferase (adenine-specific)